MSEPLSEIIHCHGCSSTMSRLIRDPITGKTNLLSTDLRKWKWIILQHHCYCANCSPQALADSIDDLWGYVQNLPKSDNP